MPYSPHPTSYPKYSPNLRFVLINNNNIIPSYPTASAEDSTGHAPN